VNRRWWSAIDDPAGGTRLRDIITGALLSALAVALILAFTELKTEGTALYNDPGWDRHLYRLMAEQGLFEFRLAPYCWRVLVPALAGWSPFSLQASFFSITLAAVWATGAVLYLLARGRGHSPAAAAVGLFLFFSLGWAAKFILADFWIPDGVAFLLVSLAFWAALEKRLYLFGAVILAGAVTKESVLLAAPLYFCLNVRRPFDWRFLVRCAAVLVPAALTLVALRLGVSQQNGDAAYFATMPEDIRRFPELYGPYNYLTLLQDIGREQRVREWGWDAFLSYTTSPLGLALPLLAALGLRRAWRLALGMLPFVTLTYVQLLFATDTQRLLVLVAPGLVVLALEGVAELRERLAVPSMALLPGAVAVFLLVLTDRQDYDIAFAPQAIVIALTATLAVAVRVARLRAGAGSEPAL
jgi:hypothetical protein